MYRLVAGASPLVTPVDGVHRSTLTAYLTGPKSLLEERLDQLTVCRRMNYAREKMIYCDVMVVPMTPSWCFGSSECVERFRPHLSRWGSFYSLKTSDPEPLWVFATETILDCLDVGRSEIKYFQSGGVMTLDKAMDREGTKNDDAVFMIPELDNTELFIGEGLAQTFRSYAPTGVVLREG